jgi:DNA-binding NtrC family response regulator
VKSAEEALTLIESCFYGLCFLDVCLPGMDGVEAMRQIKSKSPETKIAIMTAHDLDGGSRASIARSAHYFISKPFDIKEVRTIVDEALSS